MFTSNEQSAVISVAANGAIKQKTSAGLNVNENRIPNAMNKLKQIQANMLRVLLEKPSGEKETKTESSWRTQEKEAMSMLPKFDQAAGTILRGVQQKTGMYVHGRIRMQTCGVCLSGRSPFGSF